MPLHNFEVRPRPDKRGVTLLSEQLPFGSLWYGEPSAAQNAISYARHWSGANQAVIEVRDERGELVETIRHQPEHRIGADRLGRI